MSQQYDNTNKGVLFVNDKMLSDKHPSRKGSINIEGVEYWLSGWDRMTAKGETISLSVERKDAAKAQGAKPAPAKRPAPAAADVNDDIPF